MTGIAAHAAVEQFNIDRTNEALTHWRAEEQAATLGPWTYDYREIHQDLPGPYVPILELEGSSGYSGCDHYIDISEQDGTFMATARTAVPALLDVAEHVMSNDFALTIAAMCHNVDPADWLPEDQWLVDDIAARIRATVASRVTPHLPTKES